MPNSEDKVYTVAVWSGAVINIIINAILIHFVGAVGAAIATDISYFCVGLGQMFPVRKRYQWSQYLKMGIAPIGCGVFMLVVIRIIGNMMGASVLSVLIEIVAGGAIYTLA